MLTLYIWSTVIGGGMVIASLLSSISSHSEADHGQDGHGGDHGHGGADHHADHGGADHHADHGGADHHADHVGHDASEADGDAAGDGGEHGDDGADGGQEHGDEGGLVAKETAPMLAHKGPDAATDLGVLGFLKYVRPVSHFLAGFGASGLLTVAVGAVDPVAGAVAAATGITTTLIGRRISKLRSHETSSDIAEEDLLGKEAEVMIRIGPGDAPGKVRVRVKGSAPEFIAHVARPDLVLHSGEKVFVIEQMDDGGLKVDRKL